MQTADLATTNCVEPLEAAEQLIRCIPPDEDPLRLHEYLNSVCQQLSLANEMEAMIFVETRITLRFGLSKKVENSIVKLIREMRKKNHAGDAGVYKVQKPQEIVSNFPSLVDIVERDGKSFFLIKSPDGSFSIKDGIEHDDRILVPPHIKTFPYLLPRADHVMAELERYNTSPEKEVDERLYDDLLLYLQESAGLQYPEQYHLLNAWVFHTYLMECFYYSPILLLLGEPGRGKSRLGRALVHASFRGLHLESLAGPHLIRLATDYSSTLFFDLKNLGKKVRQEHTLDLLVLRGECGVTTPRVTHVGKGPFSDMRFYKLFGPTIIASNEPFDDTAFESRTFCLRMPLTLGDFPPPVTEDVALPLKERLTAFRAWHYDRALPTCNRSFAGRLGDISDPIRLIIEMVKPEAWEDVSFTIDALTQDARACHQESSEWRILMAVKVLAEYSRCDQLEVGAIWKRVNATPDGLPVLSRETVGRKLTTIGFERCRNNDGRRAISYGRKTMSALLGQYGIGFYPVVPSSRPEEALLGPIYGNL